MADRSARPWLGRAIYVALAALIIALQLIPFSTEPTRLPLPDVLLALTFAHAARRPRTVPPLIVAGVFLVADLLFLRPPGLMAALVMLASESLAAQSQGLRRATVLAEWSAVAGAILAVTVVARLAQAMLLLPVPPLGQDLIGALLTVAIYPPLALLAGLFFGLHRAAPGELDKRGQKI